jgi:predicted proteasome-type protease
MKTTTQLSFSNGTDFMRWQDRNCSRCVKAVFYNEKKDFYPEYRCKVQGQIEGQSAGIYEISARTYEAAQKADCPYIQMERKRYKKRIKNQTELEL